MKTIIELIESFNTREKIALKFRSDYRIFSWNYKELYSLILRASNFFETKGIKRGDKVVIWGPNSPEWVISYFAIIYTGAIAVPIDFKSNPVHAKKIISSSEAKFTVKTKYKPGLDIETIYFEDLFYNLEDIPESSRKNASNENQAVEFVYTSGTTGDPKGVIITHKNLMSNVSAVARRIDVNDKDRMLSVLPLSHLFEQTGNMLAPLSLGASICYIGTLKPSAIFSALKEEDITVFVAVPRILQGIKKKIKTKFSSKVLKVLFDSLCKIAKKNSLEKRKYIWFFVHKKFGSSFRFFVSGGSSLDRDTEDFWDLLGFSIVQGYGLTECSPILTANEVEDRVKGSVGKAIDNVQIKIDEKGEILAQGPNIFQGYYKMEEKTKEAFQDGWFLTEDIGEIDKEGNLFIKGRTKDVIVTPAGVNVYPDDVEGVLGEIASVKECAVVGFKTKNGEEVHAVMILEKNCKNPEQIIDEANEKLDSSQKIVSFSLWHESEFPKTTTLKVKKNIVREKIKTRKSAKSNIYEQSKIERLVLEVVPAYRGKFNNKLNLYKDLKLDSIGRVELVSAIEREFDIDFEEELINEKTSVQDLTNYLEEKTRKKSKFQDTSWNFGKVVKNSRSVFLKVIGFNIIKTVCVVKTVGTNNLRDISSPVIFASNHLSYLDQVAVIMKMPEAIRKNLATAAWEEYFKPKNNKLLYIWKRMFFYFLAFGFGIFPLSQEINYKKNLQFMGKLVDRKNSILIFPEGERSVSEDMFPLKKGIVTMVQNLKIPVVPVGIKGVEKIMPRGKILPIPGNVQVSFGKPINFKNESPEEILKKIKNEIEKLRK